jgi:hypothetical protein
MFATLFFMPKIEYMRLGSAERQSVAVPCPVRLDINRYWLEESFVLFTNQG